MMKYIKIFVVGFLVIISAQVLANGVKAETTLSKNITRSFAISSGDDVDVINKYGKVILNTWDKDSAKFSIDIVATGKSDDIVERLMAKVKVDFNYAMGFLTVETNMDKKAGALSSVLNSIEDYSKSFVNKNKVTIDYTIYIPNGVNMNLENKFGNVFINDFSGKLDLTLSHGDLRTRRVEGDSKIYLSFGKANIKEMKNGFLKLKGVDLGITNASKVAIESSSSEMSLGEIQSLKLNSRNDKIRVQQVGYVSGSGDFSDLSIDNLISDLDMNLDYGELFIDRVESDFQSIAINSKSADINLILSPNSYFSAKISGSEDRMIIPNSMLSLQKSVNDADSDLDFMLEGMVGNTRQVVGNVDIIANNADLIISIKETPIFTDRD